MDFLEMQFLLNMLFHGYVSLPEGTFQNGGKYDSLTCFVARLRRDLYITPDLILLESQWEPGFGWYRQVTRCV